MLARCCLFLASLYLSISISFAQVIVSANRDDKAIQGFTRQLQAALTEQSVRFVPAKKLAQETLDASDTRLILLGEDLLRWHMQQASPPPTIILQVSQVQGQAILGSQRSNELLLLWSNPALEQQLRLIALINPGFNRIGVPYTEQSAFLLPELRQAAQKYGFAISTRKLTAYNNSSDLRKLLERSDVLLGIDDETLFNAYSIKGLLLTSYSDRVPLIGPTGAYVNAGSLASLYSDQTDWINTLVFWLKQEPSTWPKESYALNYKTLTNQQVAHSLGFDIPSPNQLTNALMTKDAPNE